MIDSLFISHNVRSNRSRASFLIFRYPSSVFFSFDLSPKFRVSAPRIARSAISRALTGVEIAWGKVARIANYYVRTGKEKKKREARKLEG